MARWLGWTVSLSIASLTSAAHADSEEALTATLQRIGEQLQRAQRSCDFTERVTVEELDSERQVTAREVYTSRVEQRSGAAHRSLLSSVRERGTLDGRLRLKRDDQLSRDEREERRRRDRTPFDLEEQRHYRFRWDAAGDGIAFEPREPALDRGVGVARLREGQLRSIESRPSYFPIYLSELRLKSELTETPCGLLRTRFEYAGEGGLLFVRTRFRSLTVSEGHTVGSAGEDRAGHLSR